MASEKDKKNREELKQLLEEIFKQDETSKKEIMEFIDKLENGRLDNLLNKIKRRINEDNN